MDSDAQRQTYQAQMRLISVNHILTYKAETLADLKTSLGTVRHVLLSNIQLTQKVNFKHFIQNICNILTHTYNRYTVWDSVM